MSDLNRQDSSAVLSKIGLLLIFYPASEVIRWSPSLERVRKWKRMEKFARRIKEMSRQEKPYEKCQEFGPAALTDAELLAVVLRTGTEGVSSVDLARQILQSGGRDDRLDSLYHLDIPELTRIRGIGKVKAIQIVCLCELAKRLARTSSGKRIVFDRAEAIADYYMVEMRHLEQEEMRCVFLDSKCQLIADKVISKGTVNSSPASPREIFIEALRCRAVNLILLHNHPSGDPNPSYQDVMVTKKIRDAGTLIGVELQDHIIIGDQCYFSLKERGYFK